MTTGRLDQRWSGIFLLGLQGLGSLVVMSGACGGMSRMSIPARAVRDGAVLLAPGQLGGSLRRDARGAPYAAGRTRSSRSRCNAGTSTPAAPRIGPT